MDKKVKEFSIFILALEAAMIGVFVSLDLFLFYVDWDAMLIPMLSLIGIWGYDQRIYGREVHALHHGRQRPDAGRHPRAGLPAQRSDRNALRFDLLKLYALEIAPQTQQWFFLAFAVAFAIKVPLFPFPHLAPDRACRRRPPARSSWRACC